METRLEYQDIINMAKRLRTLQRIKIQGGQTEGFIKVKTDPEPAVQKKSPFQGVDYAQKYRLQDELEEENEDEQKCSGSSMSAVEEQTTVGAIPNHLDLLDDDLLQVYDTYSFNNKTENSLIIHQFKSEILDQIDVSQVVIIKGGTGCGKTTQVPQFILDNCAGNNVYCNIVVTQPRRIAAISVAKRVCQERGWNVGSIVGYQIALEKTASKDTRLLYCTTGVLLHQLILKQDLSAYTHIIIDEVHERDQETDFLLILVKRFLRTPGCRTKIILMSATINTDKFSQYFSKKISGVQVDPPVIEMQHLVKFPVYNYYLDDLINKLVMKFPEVKMNSPSIDSCGYDLAVTLVEAFHMIDKSEHKNSNFIGSVLIFLPGLHEIELMFERLTKRHSDKKNPVKEEWWLCPLHSSVTFEEQLKVFKPAPAGHRKIILATNIAESSITVPDVKYVIDYCLMKQQVQERDTCYTSLQLAWISKSQGCQRAGRVGRVMAGRVYRLVPKDMYSELTEDCSPEILRSPLDQLVLKAKRLGSDSPASVLGRAMDPPDLSNIHKTILNLKQMGALLLTRKGKYVEDDGDLTYIGHVMATLPLETQLSKLIILGHMFSLLSDCVIMAAAMSVKNMFSTPFKQQLEAYNAKLSWADSSCSDPIAFLNAYKVWRYNKSCGKFSRSGGMGEGEWARRYFIQLQGMKEVARLESEIMTRLKTLGITETPKDRTTWDESVQKPLILKLVIAGAFYPNFFIRRQVDEKEAVRLLGGRDPYSSVYLTNMPLNQPGRLYSKSIKKHFEHCGSQIGVFFDGSSKVYLQFGSSMVESNNNMESNSVLMPGKIMMAVYRAIKLRQLQIPIIIPILYPQDAAVKANALFGESPLTTYCFQKKQELPSRPNNLPGVNIHFIEINVTHIETPSKFWVTLPDMVIREKTFWIHSELNKEVTSGSLPLVTKVKVGEQVIAPYTDNGQTLFYRAVVIAVTHDMKETKSGIQVFFIDYGNSEWVAVNSVRQWTEKLSLVKDEPPLAMQCMLSEIQPSLLRNPKGTWSKDATQLFKAHFLGNNSIAKVYSVVEGVMSLTLYTYRDVERAEGKEIPFEVSFNHFLIKDGFAEKADEPYLSRENHLMREMALNSPELLQTYAVGVPTEIPEFQIEVDPPPEKDCRIKATLKGPRSPLEMSLYSTTKKSQGIEVQVEWSSVNSVLLDTYPMDPHDRMLVAGLVTQSSSGDRITLRNTTMMPNIHGLCALISMIFAPNCELRVDKSRTQLTGVICGLSYDHDTKIPYDPDNDLELTFDTIFDLSDLENINRVRFWMNYLVSGGQNWETEVSAARVAVAQAKLKEFILELLGKKRTSCGALNTGSAFRWGLVQQEHLLHPRERRGRGVEEEPVTIFPLIWGVDLEEPSFLDPEIKYNLDLLETYASGKEMMKSGLLCKLCQVYLDTLQHVRIHLQSSLHRDGKIQFLSLGSD